MRADTKYNEPSLSPNALMVLEKRYLRKDDHGEVVEEPQELFQRVAQVIASADRSYNLKQDYSESARIFYEMMTDLVFLPNSPTLMNAGTELGQLSACFVLPVEDSMQSIFNAVKATALIHQSGGGTGFSFSRLRPAGDIVGSTGGVASGPISFMRVFDTATDVIKQGGRRRGANMSILRVDHPDILDFITCKTQEGRFNNFNMSVAITDAFMQALMSGDEYELVNPRTGGVTGQLQAKDVFDHIVEGAWRNGEPGIVFIDRMNRFNPTPRLGDYESTNPCGEQILLPHESCNLGSINLAHMVTPDHRVDWAKLERTVKRATHFMDNVITVNRFPLPEIADMTLKTRKIGLGVMGFADMLIQLAIPYNSEEAECAALKIMEAINYWSTEASCDLAETRGAFPVFKDSFYPDDAFTIDTTPTEELTTLPAMLDAAPRFDWETLRDRVHNRGLRNATRTTIAPTGSISIIAGCSSGIEPLFALVYTRRNILDNDELLEVNPTFEQVARERGFYSAELMQEVAERGTIQGMERIPVDVRRVFVTSHDVSTEWHVRIQSAVQRFTDNAVSKTINAPYEATTDDVRAMFLQAYELGVKGITFYRDGSRREQVLSRGKKKREERATQAKPRPRRRPDKTRGITEKVKLGCGRTLYITINEDDMGLCEVFLSMGKSGGCLASQSEAIGRLISLALRSGIDIEAITRQLQGIRCLAPSWHNGGQTLSCADAVGKAIERYIASDNHERIQRVRIKTDLGLSPECPDCGSMVEFSEGCAVCKSCGWSQCG